MPHRRVFSSARLRNPGQIRPRQWRAWLRLPPPFDRHPTKRLAYVAYEYSDILGFIAVMHDSIFAGYRADIAGSVVIPSSGGKGSARTARAGGAAGCRRMGSTG